MMPRCGKPYPPNPASTCTKVPNNDGPHQVYWKDSLYHWYQEDLWWAMQPGVPATPPPLFLPSPSPNRDGTPRPAQPPTTRGGQS